VRIASLNVREHLDTVWDNWPHFHPDFKPVVRTMVRRNPSFGIFVATPGEEPGEQLASMIVQSDTVGLGILQTLSAHRRKGFAHTLLAHVTRLMGAAGVGPQGHVIATNYASIEMFKKLGYKIIGQSRWVSIAN